jgi:hypothetical protein
VNDAFGSSQFDRRENEFWPLAKDRKRRRDALGFGKAVEALMKIYHAFIFGRLIRLAGSKANQFAAQGREGFSLHDPDDDIEFRKEQHRARLLVGVTRLIPLSQARLYVVPERIRRVEFGHRAVLKRPYPVGFRLPSYGGVAYA